ncbi:MAG: NAD(P)-binding domain-containing protein [Ferruginibacter sp.]
MKIGIIGSGDVGRTLGSAFLKEGHEVMLGTRNVNKETVVKWKQENPAGKTGNFDTVAAFGELIVLCTLGEVANQAILAAGLDNLNGKIIIDTTNPISHSKPPVNGVIQYFTEANSSLMEVLQKTAPSAKFVKAFNSVGNNCMYQPNFSAGKPSMFICGNDADAKQTVTGILTSFGWETEDMGKAESAACIESLCILWCIPGFLRGQWSHAFKLLKK